jgi:hypothetical protein
MIKALSNQLQGKKNLLGFPTNIIGKPTGVWPTSVSFQGAHAFQGDGLGLEYHHASATWDELSLEERKKAMGSKLALVVTPR